MNKKDLKRMIRQDNLLINSPLPEAPDNEPVNFDRIWSIVMVLVLVIVALVLMCRGCSLAHAEQTPALATQAVDRIANAIYIIEGGNSTKWPYGIKSVHARNVTEARNICKRTILHKWRDWTKLTQETGLEQDFLDYLGDKYCPYSCDKQGNLNWKRNIHKLLG